MTDGGKFGLSVCVKIDIAFREDRSDAMMYQLHSEALENCHFDVFAILVTATVGHLGLPSPLNSV